jgi:putative hydrolase of the HAD superfamily
MHNPISTFAERIGKSIQDCEYLDLFEKHFMLEKHYKLEVPIKELLGELDVKYSENLVSELEKTLEGLFSAQEPFPETLEVLSRLKKDYKLGLISNTFYQSFERLEDKFKVNEIFDVILKSYETKMLKPDPRIFEIMIKKLKIKKDEALMVGDSLRYDVQAAESFGIRGILIDREDEYPEYPNRITSLEQLEKFL